MAGFPPATSRHQTSARISVACLPGPVCLSRPTSYPLTTAPILALGTETDDRLARLRAGEAASIALLTDGNGAGAARSPNRWRRYTATRSVAPAATPQMLLRVGWAPINADLLPLTPRRELSQVVEWPEELLRQRC